MNDQLTHGRVFAIAGPAMLANLTTPLLGIVATGVIGQLGEAHLLGGVGFASVDQPDEKRAALKRNHAHQPVAA